MNITKADELVQQVLSEKRYAHTIRVVETAEKLAAQYGGDMEKIRLAAMLHDYAKCFPVDWLKTYLTTYQLPQSLFNYHHELWHGPVAARMMEHEFGVHDADILNAIYYHTTGRANMTTFESIIFVADYIEPGRQFDAVHHVRQLSKTNLELAARGALKNTIQFLISKDNTIHPDSFFAYNQLTDTTILRSD